MIKNFWKDRPSTPVILAWMTAGGLTFAITGWVVYGLVCLVAFLTS